MTKDSVQPQDILLKLEEKLKSNIQQCLTLESETYKNVDFKARHYAALGQVIVADSSLLPHQKDIALIFDEVFADLILSLYFSACGLDKAAQNVLRRALELGMAVIYLWDLPQAFWNWKVHDADLNFREMIDFLLRDCYITFLQSLDPSYTGGALFDKNEANNIYRALSNTIHGKIATHTAYLPNRFSHDPAAWHDHIKLIERVLDILLSISRKRFYAYVSQLDKRVPLIIS